MKFLKKATLATAIAAAPFAANADLVALDDAVMGNTTGQAGVTIEINIDAAGISVGEIEYIDTEVDTNADGVADAGGSVVMQNLTLKNVNNLTQEIDVDTNGNLVLGVSGVTGMEIGLGATATDVTKSAVALKSQNGAVTEVVNNLDMTLNLGASTTTILNLAETTGNAAAIAALPADAQTGSVAILANASVQITDMNVGAFGYTADQAANVMGLLDGGVAGNDAGSVAKTNSLISQFNAQTGGSVAAATAGTALTPEQQAAVTTAIAGSSAIQIGGVQFYDTNAAGDKVAANIDQTIWAKGGDASLGGGVYIQLGEISGTLEVASIGIGGASIGSVKVSDINLAGMTQRIYGH